MHKITLHMKKSIIQLSSYLLYLMIILCLQTMNLYVCGESLLEVQIVAISGKDERAIVKMSDGKMEIIKRGDLLHIGSKELRVIEITEGRVVFEEKTEGGIETLIIRIEDGTQKMEKIRRNVENLPFYGPK